MTDFSPSKVDAAETADSADAVKGNDIDSDGDGIVDAADDAATLNGKSEGQLDVDKVDGNDAADLSGDRFYETASGSVTVSGYAAVSIRWRDDDLLLGDFGSGNGEVALETFVNTPHFAMVSGDTGGETYEFTVLK
jgi:hypothetical protein